MLKKAVLALLLGWMCFLLAEKISLLTADLGRHLKNGELVLSGAARGDLETVSRLMSANLYSYTAPEFPFVNHHWASGVVFHLVHAVVGFKGLSVFYTLVFLAAFTFLFLYAGEKSDLLLLLLAAFFLMSLFCSRRDIRPEGFGYLFIGLYLWTMALWERGRIRGVHLCVILPAMSLLWVNMHISSFFGPAIIGVVLIDRAFVAMRERRRKGEAQSLLADPGAKTLLCALGLTLAAGCLNPHGLKLLLYPLQIFENYGYEVVENQSIFVLGNDDRFGDVPEFWLLKAALGILWASHLLVLVVDRDEFSIRHLLFSVMVTALALFAIRNFVLFAFFSLPAMAHNLTVIGRTGKSFRVVAAAVLIAVSVIYIVRYRESFDHRCHRFGIGLDRGANACAEFIKSNDLSGPIFNNYDVGGYLIYHLYPEQSVFVDNRPEAYPAEFFAKTYIPMQTDEVVWMRADSYFKFNLIVFHHGEVTGWTRGFLDRRVDDAMWVPVYLDDQMLVLLRNTEANQDVVRKNVIWR